MITVSHVFRVKNSITIFGVTVDQTGGLWQNCVSGGGESQCVSIGSCDSDGFDGCTKLNGGRAFMILTILASVSVTILILLNLCSETPNPSMVQTTRFGALIVLPLGIIGLALGISAYSGLHGSIGPAGILGIVAIVVNLVAGAVGAMIR